MSERTYDAQMLLFGMNRAIDSTDKEKLNEYLDIEDTDTSALTRLVKDTGSIIMQKYHENAMYHFKHMIRHDYGEGTPKGHIRTSEGLHNGNTDISLPELTDVEDFCERIRSAECDHFVELTPGQKDFLTGIYMIYTEIERDTGHIFPYQKYIKTVDELVTSLKEHLHTSILESIEDSACEYMETFSYYNYYGYLPED